MAQDLSALAGTGLEVLELDAVPGFADRQIHRSKAAEQMEGLRRVARAFVETPDSILQELVNTAVDLCGAESAGISIQTLNAEGETLYHWAATAGQYSGFLNAMLPSFPSACGLCLERGTPQLFRVSKVFFEKMGVEAPIVTDGLLLPWTEGDTRGTVWIMSHTHDEAFDKDDKRVMEVLADFAAMAVRQQKQQKLLIDQATTAAAAAMANELAHNINNPLQGLTNLVFLAAEGGHGENLPALAKEMSGDLARLTELVRKLLVLPSAKPRASGVI